jgi:hypothetical protein
MENETQNTGETTLIERIGDYTKTNYSLMKLKTIRKSAHVTSVFVSRSLVAVAFSLFTVLLSLGCSFWLGTKLNNTSYGFFCVALFYGLLGLIIYFLLHKRIKMSIQKHIISQLLN